MNNKRGKTKKRYQCVILTAKESKTRLIIRKNNPAKNKSKLDFMKYCPILRKKILFKETGKERHLK